MAKKILKKWNKVLGNVLGEMAISETRTHHKVMVGKQYDISIRPTEWNIVPRNRAMHV